MVDKKWIAVRFTLIMPYIVLYTYYIYQEKSPSDVKYCFMMSNMVWHVSYANCHIRVKSEILEQFHIQVHRYLLHVFSLKCFNLDLLVLFAVVLSLIYHSIWLTFKKKTYSQNSTSLMCESASTLPLSLPCFPVNVFAISNFTSQTAADELLCVCIAQFSLPTPSACAKNTVVESATLVRVGTRPVQFSSCQTGACWATATWMSFRLSFFPPRLELADYHLAPTWTGLSLRVSSVGWTSTPRRLVASGSQSSSSSGFWSSWWLARRSGATSRRTLTATPGNPVATMCAMTTTTPSLTLASGLCSWSLSPAHRSLWRFMSPTAKIVSASIGSSTERIASPFTTTRGRSEVASGGPTSWACCSR